MPTAVIAGGGIAGMAAALGLAQAGWHVTVCERADRLGEVGAGVQISPNACKVLEWLGVLPALSAHVFEPEAAVLRDGITGGQIYRAPLHSTGEWRWGGPYLHVHRADLHTVLADTARQSGVDIRLGTPVARAVMRPENAGLHLESGEIIEADLVLGADGIRSALRHGLARDEEPRFTGQVAWRALVPVDTFPKDLVAPDATVWAGHGRHLVTYYLRGGEMVNLVGVLEQDSWTAEGWSTKGDPRAFRAAFADWHLDVGVLLEAVQECYLWGLFDRPEQVRWVKGRLALIGDAAHPMLPFMAQGAAQALEDAAALVRHLADPDIPRALESWEAERWPRATRILQTARANGRMFHRAPGLARTMSRLLMRTVTKIAPGVATGQLDWLYGFDPVKGH
ncbi:MAG: FAD-dependent monooxygenase [Paracoccaceae bacterium]